MDFELSVSFLATIDGYRVWLIIDTKLNWKEHVNYAAMKAYTILNLLRRNLHHSSKTAKTKAYTGLVRPHLEYAAPVWSPHKACDISKLEKVQKRAARWIAAKWNSTQWDKSYKECNSTGSLWLNVMSS